MNLLKDLAKASGNDLAGVVSDGIVAGDVDGYIDTGSYIFNACLLYTSPSPRDATLSRMPSSA